MGFKKRKNEDEQGVPEPDPGELDPPGPVDAYLLVDVAAPMLTKEEGEAALQRHFEKSGELPADVRLVRVKEVKSKK